ncbi:MAG TPA: tetratricopeptide repeat protein, partial [Elusimicrobiota bacterium]|nr:tetratricopeptide repeat protein [Elusimicrobiota bacterium]
TEAPPRWTTHRRLGLAGVVLFAGAGFASYALFRSGQCVERARIEFESGRWPAAREWVDRGLRWNRWNPELYDLGAALRLVARDVDGAARDLDRCVGLAPTSAGFRRDAAELALRRSRPEEALAHYDAAVRFLPLSPVPWVRRGDLLRSLGRLADAEASYRSALRALADPRVMAGAPDTRAALTTQVNAKLAEVLP